MLGGVPRRDVFNNMRTAVDRVGTGRARQVNALCHHGPPLPIRAELLLCSVGMGDVQNAPRQIWSARPGFADLPSLNAWLEALCVERWDEIAHEALPGSVADVHAQERPSLMPPGRPFDGFVEHTERVSPTCLVHFETSRYSIPASFANRPMSLRVYSERLVVVAEGQIVCQYARVVKRAHNIPHRTVYDWRHDLAVIQRKPGALRNGAPFTEMPEPFDLLQSQLLQRPRGDREMVEFWHSCFSTTSRR